MKKYFKRIFNKDYNSFLNILHKNLDNKKRTFIVTANPNTFMVACEDIVIRKMLLDKEVLVVPDGVGIIKALRMLKYKVKERITGVDLSYDLLKYANEKKYSVYFFGATEEVRIKLVDKVKNDYPNVKIVGSSNGYVEDKDKVFNEIFKLKPDIVLVGMGIPMQEKLIYKHIDRFKKGIFMGVGGSFDVISGTKKRAPKLFIKLNLEWLYRILREPKRIKSFYRNNIKFIFRIQKMK